MRTLIFDIEADNLLPMTSQVWVVCVDVDGVVHSLRSSDELKRLIRDVRPDRVIGHNILGFDLPALRKVWGVGYSVGRKDSWCGVDTLFVDTLHLSMYLNPDRKPGHSLEDWGTVLGFPKGSHSDWSRYTPEMEAYCRQDVRVTERVYRTLMRELEEKCG